MDLEGVNQSAPWIEFIALGWKEESTDAHLPPDFNWVEKWTGKGKSKGTPSQIHFLASDNPAQEWQKDHPVASSLSLSKACDIGREMNKALTAKPMGQD